MLRKTGSVTRADDRDKRVAESVKSSKASQTMVGNVDGSNAIYGAVVQLINDYGRATVAGFPRSSSLSMANHPRSPKNFS